ncbi:hypothetical protein SAMN04488137_0579 [Fictibacillus solisalsi]|uniref:Uncharacterized protein n=1 Tax=Fictibacillus solisalsi TaxID=459525 RepID=A0A1G9TY97_9BACL|nr:hypothetical protein [Fictibacillus solisalsi]SDM52581.1 hypothetical protein SAMN04488137_0579 [Fictibacillus solisalsi]
MARGLDVLGSQPVSLKSDRKGVTLKPRIEFPKVGISHHTLQVMEENERIIQKGQRRSTFKHR